MKRFYYLLFLILCSPVLMWGQATLFSENLGTPSGTTAIASYTGWQNSSLAFSKGGAVNPADIRSTNASISYAGASGGGNVFFTSTSGEYGFSIENINAGGYTNLTLQFGYRKESATVLPTLAVDYWDGTTWINVPFTFTEAATAPVGWYLSPVMNLPAGAQVAGLKLRWVKTGTASTRVDDVVLKGVQASTPTLTGGTVNDFGSVTVGTASATQSFDVAGLNLTGFPGNITVTSPSSDFEVSGNGTSWSGTATVAYTSATLAATPVFVRFTPQSAGPKSGNVVLSGGGASPVNVAVTGTGFVPAPPVPVATAATSVANTGFTANWNAVSGATGYRLDVYTLSTGTVTSDVATWTFPTNTSASQTATGGNSNNSSQTITATGVTTPFTYPGGPSPATGATPNSVSANGWDNGMDSKYWQIDLNTTGVANLTLSSLQGSSSTGPSAFKIQYRIGAGGTWTDVPGGTVSIATAVTAGSATNWYGPSNLALPAAAANQPFVSIRWISTSNTSVNGGTVSATGTSRISAIYVRGDVTSNVATYVTSYQNLSVGNATSQVVTGLTSNTTYYYVVRAENSGGASANSNEISVTTPVVITPTLTSGTLAGFGNVCINTSSVPASFTISGSSLTAGDITVGPLAGYSFGTTSGGPFTSTLTLTQPGGTFSQSVFVRFDPDAVQAYNGSIPVAGGGATAISVAATGSGVNSAPSVTTGASTGVTASTATLAGAIPAAGCASVTAYGIEYSLVNGFTDGSGTQVSASNLSGTSFSIGLAGLTSSTTYYYKAYATSAAGTSYGIQQQFTTASALPAITTTAIASFGGVCINTAAGPNSFTISGINLTAADIVINPLAGYTFSTTAGGTYTPSLTLPQPGGTFSQTVFVRFTPAALQSYSGSFTVGGGGTTTATSVGVVGNGINTAPAVTTGMATAVTFNSANAPGVVDAFGCSSVTAYGIEYSTTNGFTSGTGTSVPGANLTGTSYTVALTGLTPGTIYYFKAYATNAGGTSYGAQQQFATAAPPPPSLVATALQAFGNVCANTASPANSFVLTGSNLTAADVVVGPLAAYSFSTTAAGTYTSSLTLPATGGSINQAVFVKFTPVAAQNYTGNIPVSGGGITSPVSVGAIGLGVNTAPSVTTGDSSGIQATSVNASGSITANGCSGVTEYGIEYSGINNFTGGSGTQVTATGAGNGAFTVAIKGLVPETKYYYRAYARNGGGVSYGPVKSFTTGSLPDGFAVYPIPVVRNSSLHFVFKGLKLGWYGINLYNGAGQKVYTRGYSIQGNYLMESIRVPGSLQPGTYQLQLVDSNGTISVKTIVVF